MGKPPDRREGPQDTLRGYRLHLDAEERAFLGLVRPAPVAPPTDEIDWRMVGDLARIHRLEGRLYRAVERNIVAPPDAVATSVRKAAFGHLHGSLPILQQRDRLIHILAEEGIVPMVVKGAALVDSLYRDAALRPMDDVDLLLPDGAGARVEALAPRLRDAGIDLRRFEIEEDHHDLTMDGTYRLDFPRLWSDSRPAPFADGLARIPSLEDQLLLVCVSCCRNSFWRLVTILDAAEILHRHHGDLDWDRIAARAHQWELAPALDTLLALTGMLFGVDAPERARAPLAPEAWRRRCIRELLGAYRLHAGGGLEAVNIPRPIAAFALKYSVSTPRVLLRQARSVLFPDWRWMRSHYPRAGRTELVLRYLAHPFVVAGLAARLVLRRGR